MATVGTEPISLGVRVGVDIGQRVDPTAICVVEVQRRDYELNRQQKPTGGECHFMARHLERLPLGTPYPSVVDRLTGIHQKLLEAQDRVPFWVDATGVGQPVIDLLRRAGLPVVAVYLTGSEKAVEEEIGELHLGKALLVSRLQVLLQQGRIHLPRTAEAQALIDELLSFEIRVSDAGHAQFGVFKVGTHDDLVTSLGLACWQEPMPNVPFAADGQPSRWETEGQVPYSGMERRERRRWRSAP